MKEIWGFQWTTSLIGSNRVTVAKNATILVGRLHRHMVSRSGEVMLQDPLARASSGACGILGITFEEEKMDHWGHAMGTWLKMLKWNNWDSRDPLGAPHLLIASSAPGSRHRPGSLVGGLPLASEDGIWVALAHVI